MPINLSKSERTRAFILEKAAPVFNTKGYAGTSMNDVMEVTGLTKGAIYGHFENKDALALEVYDYNLSLLVNALQEKVNKQTQAVDKLLSITAFYRSEAKKVFQRGGCAILNTAIESDDVHPGLKERVSESLRRWKKSIVLILKKGIEDKELKKTIDPGQIAVVMIALIEGGIMQTKVTGDMSILSACLQHIEDMIEKDLKK